MISGGLAFFAQPLGLVRNRAVKEQNPVFTIQLVQQFTAD
jgi:hypothetical protein